MWNLKKADLWVPVGQMHASTIYLVRSTKLQSSTILFVSHLVFLGLVKRFLTRNNFLFKAWLPSSYNNHTAGMACYLKRDIRIKHIENWKWNLPKDALPWIILVEEAQPTQRSPSAWLNQNFKTDISTKAVGEARTTLCTLQKSHKVRKGPQAQVTKLHKRYRVHKFGPYLFLISWKNVGATFVLGWTFSSGCQPGNLFFWW